MSIPKFNPVTFLVIVTTSALVIMLGALLFVDMPEANADTIKGTLGQVVIAWVGIVAYYFGSTQSSARKTELLHGNGGNPPRDGE